MYCSANGFKQEVKCLVDSRVNGTELESYITFQGCPTNDAQGGFGAVVRFEVRMHSLHPRALLVYFTNACALSGTAQFLMLLLFLLSFGFVKRRKKRNLAIQHHRIASYLQH